AKWTIQDAEAVPGSKQIDAATPLVVEGDAYVKTKVDNSGLHLSMDENKLNSQITNQITNNTTVNQHGTDITALKAGFTVSNEAGTKQDITLGGAAKQDIQFVGEANKIDVAVDNAADGAKVTITANPNLGTNIDISNNSTITNLDNRVTTNAGNITNNTSNITKLQAGFDLKAGSTTSNVALGGVKPTVEFATADDTMTVGLTGTKVTYGIDKTKLVQNITGDVINQINTTTSNPVTNI
ncbi:hypothetical protein, partial [Pyramidobacter sp. CG50-2]|uniref:hypothetical protein n=1 Tax=Pyramidobacter sp. CG50-2 TaxID=2382160 RepID=UPI000EDC2259